MEVCVDCAELVCDKYLKLLQMIKCKGVINRVYINHTSEFIHLSY